MANHLVTYRNAGFSVDLEVPGSRDPGEVCNAVRDRLFNLSEEEKAKQQAHADAVLERWSRK